MPTSKLSTYKGYRITTRWIDLHLSDTRQRNGFDAAFAVRPIAVDGESWQQFPRAVFDTPAAAEANALDAAQRSIDDFGGSQDIGIRFGRIG